MKLLSLGLLFGPTSASWPTGWQWYPSFSADSTIYISSNDENIGVAGNWEACSSAASGVGARLLTCDEVVNWPQYGVLIPGKAYACDDQIGRGAACGVFQNGEISDDCTSSVDFIGVVDHDCHMYHHPTESNEGVLYDHLTCRSGVANWQTAASICSARNMRMYQTEVEMFNQPGDATHRDSPGGCKAAQLSSLQAEQRIKVADQELPDIDFTGKIWTGYVSNADGSNWNYFDGTSELATDTNVAFGYYTIPGYNYLPPTSGGTKCMLSSALWSNFQDDKYAEIDPSAVDISGKCVYYDAGCDDSDCKYFRMSDCSTADYSFACERHHWDCSVDNGGCSDTCHSGGYCSCSVEGEYLKDFFTCEPIPVSLATIKCTESTITFTCPTADVNDANGLGLLNSTCNIDSGHIKEAGDVYIITLDLDECGTEVTMNEEDGTITFSNEMINRYDTPEESINMESRVRIDFSCTYNMLIDVDSISYNMTENHIQSGRNGGGSFSFDLLTYDDDTFTAQHDGSARRVGEVNYFAVEQTNGLESMVFQTNSCKVCTAEDASAEGTECYAVYNNNCFDPYVNFQRYSAIVERQSVVKTDQFSFTSFEFINQFQKADVPQAQFLSCTVSACLRDDNDACNHACPTGN